MLCVLFWYWREHKMLYLLFFCAFMRSYVYKFYLYTLWQGHAMLHNFAIISSRNVISIISFLFFLRLHAVSQSHVLLTTKWRDHNMSIELISKCYIPIEYNIRAYATCMTNGIPCFQRLCFCLSQVCDKLWADAVIVFYSDLWFTFSYNIFEN